MHKKSRPNIGRHKKNHECFLVLRGASFTSPP